MHFCPLLINRSAFIWILVIKQVQFFSKNNHVFFIYMILYNVMPPPPPKKKKKEVLTTRELSELKRMMGRFEIYSDR